MLTYSIILLIVLLFQIVIVAILYKQFATIRAKPNISNIESQLNQSIEDFNKKNMSAINKEFDEIKTKLKSSINKEIRDSKNSIEKLLQGKVSEDIVKRLKPAIKSSLEEENIEDILTKVIEGKDESKEWEKLLNKKSDDFHLIEILTKNYAHNIEISKTLYTSLLKDYEGENNIAVKREILKILDSLTDNMLLTSDVKNYEDVKKKKIEVEELYGDLAKQMQIREYDLINEKVDKLSSLLDEIEDINSMETHNEYLREINEIDSSIDFNILQNDKTLFEKYNTILNELSSKIEKSKNLIIKKENREAIQKAEKLKKDFENATSVFNNEYDAKLIKSLVEDLSLHNKHHLLPSTYEYCESIRHQIVEKLTAKQRRQYVIKTVNYSFKEK